jgi:hypothetical protein
MLRSLYFPFVVGLQNQKTETVKFRSSSFRFPRETPGLTRVLEMLMSVPMLHRRPNPRGRIKSQSRVGMMIMSMLMSVFMRVALGLRLMVVVRSASCC